MILLHRTKEFLGPMTTLTGILGRPKVPDGRLDRPMVNIPDRGIDLIGPRKLGPDEPFGAFSDMALNAIDPGVRGLVVRRIFRLHHGVTKLAAERSGLCKIVGPVDPQGRKKQENGQDSQVV